MITPTPRPALRKAPDANIHPADPAQAAGPAPVPGPRVSDAPPVARSSKAVTDPRVVRLPSAAPTSRGKRLSGPPRGATSDTLRPVKEVRRPEPATPPKRNVAKEKQVDLAVKVPKSLRKDLRAAAKSAGRTPDEVVASLIRVWIGN